MTQPNALYEVSTRPATSADEPFLIEVYAASRQDEIQNWGWPAEQFKSFVRMQFNARRQSYALIYPAASERVILCGGTPVGSIIVSRGPSEIRLVDIALLPDYRNRGIGGRQIAALIAEAVRSQLPLRLSVVRGNVAANLYHRLGFVASGGDAIYLEMEYDPKARSDR